jgi:hypothetical protein
MTLFGELLLAEFIEHIEFFTETIDEFITNRGELDLNNDLSIGHHHCYSSE